MLLPFLRLRSINIFRINPFHTFYQSYIEQGISKAVFEAAYINRSRTVCVKVETWKDTKFMLKKIKDMKVFQNKLSG